MSNDYGRYANHTYQRGGGRPLNHSEEDYKRAATRAAERYGWANRNDKATNSGLRRQDSYMEPAVARAGVELFPGHVFPGNYQLTFDPHHPHFRGERHNTIREPAPVARRTIDSRPRTPWPDAPRKGRSLHEEIYEQPRSHGATGPYHQMQSEYKLSSRSQTYTGSTPVPIRTPSPTRRRRRDSNGVSECDSEDDGQRNYNISPIASRDTFRRLQRQDRTQRRQRSHRCCTTL
ncbi:hypothetical protein F5Y04DRAFT_278419 [Hypomontagnella monticulosa]|nr:hypothetical protein F5Y04DRAFT_278419 [Hypomontagnella monticulosa]